MDTRPLLLSAVLLVVSLGITAGAFLFGLPFFFVFLFIPLIPLFGAPAKWTCPACGWSTRGDERFCPYDGTRLKAPDTPGEKPDS